MSFSSEVVSTVSDIVSFVEEKSTVSRTCIGDGGFGSVFSVSDGQTSWAEKEMMLFNYDIVSQNLREANYHKWFPKTDNLIKPYSVSIKKSENTNVISITMPLGKMSLFDYINNTTSKERLPHFHKVFSQVCLGLAPIHSNGMVHTDIKSRNLLIDPATHQITVIDLSGVRFEVNETTDHTSTATYRPPELFDLYERNLKPREKYGPHNDVWSIGITMLEYITGENRVEACDTERDIGLFVNRDKQFPVRKIMIEDGIYPDEIKDITNIIENALVRRIEDILSMYEMYNLFSVERLPSLVIEYSEYKIVESDERNTAIQHQHMCAIKSSCDSVMYAFELGVNICDRYCYKTSETFTNNLLEKCLYIAVCFLTDDGYDGDWSELFFSDFDNVKSQIINIITVLEFDIYRPTFYSYLQKKKQIITPFDRSVIFQLMSDVNNHNGSECHDRVFDLFVDLISKKFDTPVKTTRDRREFITPFKKQHSPPPFCSVSYAPEFKMPYLDDISDPKIRHIKAIKYMTQYINECIGIVNKSIAAEKLFNYLIKYKVLDIDAFKGKFADTVKSKLDEFEIEVNAGWIPIVKSKLFPKVL